MSHPETSQILQENPKQHNNIINDLDEKSRKELFERLKEDKKIPLSSIIKELKEHDVVSYLYSEEPTNDAFGGEHTFVNELGFIHDGAKNMVRGSVYNYLTFKKEGDGAYVYLNEVRWSSFEGFAHIKKLKLNEFAEFVHEYN